MRKSYISIVRILISPKAFEQNEAAFVQKKPNKEVITDFSIACIMQNSG